jgi:hypothetical protein
VEAAVDDGKIEVRFELIEQLVVRIDAGEDALGAARLDQHVPERIVDAGQQYHAPLLLGSETYTESEFVGTSCDVVARECGRDLLGRVIQLVERPGLIVGRKRVGAASQNTITVGPGDEPRSQQRAVRRVAGVRSAN